MARKASSKPTNQAKEIIKAFQAFEEAKGLSVEVIAETLRESLVQAYQKSMQPNNKSNLSDVMARADVNVQTGVVALYNIKNVVEEVMDDALEISLEDARIAKPDIQIGDEFEIPVDITQFARATAMQVKLNLKQKIREKEKESIYNEYITKKDEIVTGIIEKVNEKSLLINLGRVVAVMPQIYYIPGEEYKAGDHLKVYIVDVTKESKKSPVVVSRCEPNFLRRLFEQEVSEVYDGTVEIKSIAREAGDRSKVAVWSKNPNVDATGACIGPKGGRIQSISSQLLGEKIDVIQYHEIPELYVAEALKPANIYGLAVDKELRSMIAVVPNEDFSLAIGKKGQNARLAVKLTGWKIDIKTVDDAMRGNIKYRLLSDIKREVAEGKYMEEKAKKAIFDDLMESVIVPTTPISDLDYMDDEIDDSLQISTNTETEASQPEVETPVAEEKTIISKKDIYETSSTYTYTSKIESSLEAQQNKNDYAPKRDYKKDRFEKAKDKEKEEVVVEENVVTPTPAKNYMPVYSEEELRELDELEAEEENYYDDDVDYDDYDDYYDN